LFQLDEYYIELAHSRFGYITSNHLYTEMWGSALADLAKRAREQADQMHLNEVVAQNLTGALSAFNLDSMRDHDDPVVQPSNKVYTQSEQDRSSEQQQQLEEEQQSQEQHKSELTKQLQTASEQEPNETDETNPQPEIAVDQPNPSLEEYPKQDNCSASSPEETCTESDSPNENQVNDDDHSLQQSDIENTVSEDFDETWGQNAQKSFAKEEALVKLARHFVQEEDEVASKSSSLLPEEETWEDEVDEGDLFDDEEIDEEDDDDEESADFSSEEDHSTLEEHDAPVEDDFPPIEEAIVSFPHQQSSPYVSSEEEDDEPIRFNTCSPRTSDIDDVNVETLVGGDPILAEPGPMDGFSIGDDDKDEQPQLSSAASSQTEINGEVSQDKHLSKPEVIERWSSVDYDREQWSESDQDDLEIHDDSKPIEETTIEETTIEETTMEETTIEQTTIEQTTIEETTMEETTIEETTMEETTIEETTIEETTMDSKIEDLVMDEPEHKPEPLLHQDNNTTPLNGHCNEISPEHTLPDKISTVENVSTDAVSKSLSKRVEPEKQNTDKVSSETDEQRYSEDLVNEKPLKDTIGSPQDLNPPVASQMLHFVDQAVKTNNNSNTVSSTTSSKEPSKRTVDVGGLFASFFLPDTKVPTAANKTEIPPKQEILKPSVLPKPVIPSPASTIQSKTVQSQNDRDREHEETIKRFVEQMQRLDEHHAAEKAELTKFYDAQLEQLQTQVTTLESRSKSNTNTVSTNVKQQLEEQENRIKLEFETKLKAFQTSLDEEKQRCSDLASKHNTTLVEKEETIHSLRTKLAAANSKVTNLETCLLEEEQKSQSSVEQYETLKNRVKSVATELKERRIECRTLASQLEELTSSNSHLKFEVDKLQMDLATKTAQLEQMQNVEEHHETAVKMLETKVAALEKELKEEKNRGEKALSTYKAKSVRALGDAQRRVAAANQGKADAETELEVLRVHVEEMQVTMDAMSDRVEDRLKDSKETIASLEKSLIEKDILLGDMQEDLTFAKDEAEKAVEARERMEQEMQQTRNEWEEIQCSYQKELERNRELTKANTQMESDLKNLRNELNIVREEYEDLQVDLHKGGSGSITKRRARSSVGSLNGDHADGEGYDLQSGYRHQPDGHDMVAILQEELQEANSAIAGLKEALRQALNNQSQKHSSGKVRAKHSRLDDDDDDDDNSSVSSQADFATSPSRSRGGSSYAEISLRDHDSEAPPQSALFFAFEKQAELNTARDEINRLANLVGEEQTAKQLVIDKLAQLGRELEDTKAKLQLQSKLLGYSDAAKKHQQQQIQTPNNPIGMSRFGATKSLITSPVENTAEEAAKAAAANVEYLKHVMLRYLHAKTTNEKRSLLPVVSAVLCLTTDEKSGVEQAIQETGGLTGMGNAFFESLESLSGKSSSNSSSAGASRTSNSAHATSAPRQGLW